jgi:hypothetical protein
MVVVVVVKLVVEVGPLGTLMGARTGAEEEGVMLEQGGLVIVGPDKRVELHMIIGALELMIQDRLGLVVLLDVTLADGGRWMIDGHGGRGFRKDPRRAHFETRARPDRRGGPGGRVYLGMVAALLGAERRPLREGGLN